MVFASDYRNNLIITALPDKETQQGLDPDSDIKALDISTEIKDHHP